MSFKSGSAKEGRRTYEIDWDMYEQQSSIRKYSAFLLLGSTLGKECLAAIDLACAYIDNVSPYHSIYKLHVFFSNYIYMFARCAGSDGSMSASGSAGPGFNPRRGSKY